MAVTTKEGAPYKGPVWPGDCVFPDFTSTNSLAINLY